MKPIQDTGGGIADSPTHAMPEGMHAADPQTPSGMRSSMAKSTGGPKRPGIEAARGKVGQPQPRDPGSDPSRDPTNPLDAADAIWRRGQDFARTGDVQRDIIAPQLAGLGMDGTVPSRQNPMLPWDTVIADEQTMYHLGKRLGEKWNGFVNAGTSSVEDMGRDWNHLPEWKQSALRNAIANWGPSGQVAANIPGAAPWITEHVMPQLLQIGANFDMIPFALSLAGQAPKDQSKLPEYFSSVTGLMSLFKDFDKGPKPLDLGWDAKLLWHSTQAAMMAAALKLHVPGKKIFGAAGFGDGVGTAFEEMSGKVKMPKFGISPAQDDPALAGTNPYIGHVLATLKTAASERTIARTAQAEEASAADKLAQTHGFNDIIHFLEQRTAAAGADAMARPAMSADTAQALIRDHLGGDAAVDPQLLRKQKATEAKAQAEWDKFNNAQEAHQTISSLDPAHLAELDKAGAIPKAGDRPRFDTALLYTPKPADPAAARLWENRQADLFQQWKKYAGIKGLTDKQLHQDITTRLKNEVKTARDRLTADETARIKRLGEHYAALSKLGPAVGNRDDLVRLAEKGVLTDEQATHLQKSWGELDLPYDLKRKYADGRDIPDPRQTVNLLPNKAAGMEVLGNLNALFKIAATGPYGHGEALMGGVFRSLVGGTRATKAFKDRYVRSVAYMLISNGVKDYSKINDAIELVPGSYEKLGPAEKLAVDAHALLYGHIGDQNVAAGRLKPEDLIPGYLPHKPRVNQLTGSRRGAAPATAAQAVNYSKRQGHRTYMPAVNDMGEVNVQQRFPTIREANAEMTRQRASLAEKIRQEHPDWKPSQVNAQVDAEKPLFEDDYLNMLSRDLGASINKLHAKQAVDILEHTIGEFTSADGRKVQGPLVWRSSGGNEGELGGRVDSGDLSQSRANSAARGMPHGYQEIAGFGQPGVYFHPDFAKHVEKAIRFIGDNKKWHGAKWQSLLDIENVAIRNIMYSPMIHAVNVAHRATMLTVAHPVSMFSTIKGYHGLDKAAREELWTQAEAEAFGAGLMPHSPHQNAFSEFNQKAMQETGDMEYADAAGSLDQRDVNPWFKASGIAGKAQLGWNRGFGYQTVTNYFWGQVQNFGVLAYHVEKDAAKAHGLDEVSARLYASDKANMWMGAMRPEQWYSQDVNKFFRAVMFAPNWWRTWMRLLTGHYDQTGIPVSKEMKALWAKNEMKTLTAMLGVQKMSGALLNYMGSGHLQDQNAPGSQDKINVSRLATQLNGLGKHMSAGETPPISALDTVTGGAESKFLGQGLSSIQGSDQTTGGELYIENPLGRQPQSTERALGFQSGHPGWQPSDAAQGLAETVIDRLSPLMSAITAFGNVDLHRSIYDGQWRHVDPRASGPNPASALQGLADLTPMGYPLSYNIERDLMAGKDPVGPWGTHIPGLLKETMKNVPLSAMMGALTALTGIVPPYLQAEKTRGTKPADNQYVQYAEAKAKHEDNVKALWTQLHTGAIDPAQWLSEHRQVQQKYDDMAQNTFGNSSSYTKGTMGLVSQWEKTYQDAESTVSVTDPATGQVNHIQQLDYNKLDTLQQQMRTRLTQDQRSALDAELHKNDMKDPGAKLYHDAVGAYRDFQKEAARTLGVDEATLHQASLQSYQAGKDPATAAAFAKEHPYMRRYAQLKSAWETQSWAGLLYGMYYDTSVVTRWIKAHGGHSMADRVVQTNAQAEGFK